MPKVEDLINDPYVEFKDITNDVERGSIKGLLGRLKYQIDPPLSQQERLEAVKKLKTFLERNTGSKMVPELLAAVLEELSSKPI